MQFSAKLTMIFAAIFAVASFAVAFTGFSSLGEIVDPQVASDARGFAWFWLFLGCLAVAFGLASWWIVRTAPRDGDG